MNDSVALVRAQDLALDLLHRTARWPKRLRHALTGRVESAAIDLLGAISRAQSAPRGGRPAWLRRADENLAELRVLLRLSGDLGLLSAGAVAHVTDRMDEIGRLVGGWLRAGRPRDRVQHAAP